MAINITSGSISVNGTLKITRIFFAPSDILLSGSTISELASNGTVIGTATAVDIDPGDTFTWALTVNAGGKFAIHPTNGQVYVNAPLDFETNPTHNITIEVTDSHGLSYSEAFVITVTDEVENSPPVDITLSRNSTSRWSLNVATATATDPDLGDTATWLLTNDASGKYDIVSGTGIITPQTYPVDVGSHSITIRATDSALNTYDEAFVMESLIKKEIIRLQASDAATDDEFGYSVAVSADGNTVAVGSAQDDNSGGTNAGSVYVFIKSGSTWTQQTRLQASDAAASDRFGNSVALSSDGNTIIIGAPYDDNSGGTDAGSAYVFTRSGSTWTQQTRLQISSASATDLCGWSVALSFDGNTAIVGLYLDDHSRTDAGSVYVFTRSGSTWSQQQQLVASDADTNDRFGYSVALSFDGNTALIGAYQDDNSGGTDAGSAYVFTRSGSVWTQEARIQASDAAASDQFGFSVALSSDGSTAIIGTCFDDNSGGSNAGSAYVFTRSGTTWTQQTRLQASDAAAGDLFGYSVSISSDGNIAAIGAASDDNSGGSGAGSIYIFTRSGTTWTEQTRIQASDAVTSDDFGVSCSLSSGGNVLVVGAYQDDNSGGSNAGSAYIYNLYSTMYKPVVKLQASDAAADDNLGLSIVISADGNTALFGSHGDDNSGGSNAGSAYVFIRSGSTWTEQTRLQASDAAANDFFGYSVALSSDGNTAIVGAYQDDNSGGSNAGSAYVFTRSGSTWTQQQRLQASDAAADDNFGISVALSSDGNTALIGASVDDNSGGSNAGSAYVFTRSGSTWTQQQRLQAGDAAADDNFGISVALSSDGNTALIGASVDDNSGGTDAGSAYVFTRSGSTWTQQQRLQAGDAIASDQFGRSVALSSDGNTALIGAYLDNNSGGADAGSAYVFTRSGVTWTEQTRLQASDAATSDQFGRSVALSSDGNIAVVGAFLDNIFNVPDAGSAYVFTRTGSTWTQRQKIQAADLADTDRFAISSTISSNGDTLMIGANVDDNSGGANAGSVYVYSINE